MGVASARNGASAASAASGAPAKAIMHRNTVLPWASGGRNGSGGAGITEAIALSSSGAASASAAKRATTSGVAGSTSGPPVNCGSGCSRYFQRVTTPKLPPPPRTAQNRSACCVSSAITMSPDAVTTSAAMTESMVSPCLRTR